MFRSLVGQLFKTSRPTLDNLVFRLHYRVTVGLLLACAVALLWKINYGRPISCISHDFEGSQFLTDHCWYDGTYTVPSLRYLKVGVEVPAPGIGGAQGEKEYHNIHRWVVIAVLVQAVFFYLPRVIWRSLEGGLVSRWTWNVKGTMDSTRKEMIANYLIHSSYKNIIFVAGHLLCELLNLLNVVAQLFLVSHILQLSFPSVDLFVTSRSQRIDPSSLISFPLQTKCVLYRYGRSGDVQLHSATCLMSVNGVMESIFIYQWIWFVLLALLSVLALFYRFMSLVLPPFRVMRLGTKANLTNQTTLENVVRRLGIAEWFVLYMLSKNLDPIHTRDIMDLLEDRLAPKEQFYPLSEIQHVPY